MRDRPCGYTATTVNCGGTQDQAGTKCESVTTFARFFGDGSTTPTNKTGTPITVHGIVCPSGQACGCASGTCTISNGTREFNPQPIGGQSQLRHAAVVNATHGVLGSVVDSASIQASMEAIVATTVANGGKTLSRSPQGASLKVSVQSVADPAVCTSRADLPRSRVNGFDYEGNSRALSFFGACRPASPTSPIAVSYTHFVDTVKAPNGGAPCKEDANYTPSEPDHCIGPLLGCDPAGTQCVCKPNCGDSCDTGQRCDAASCSCQPL